MAKLRAGLYARVSDDKAGASRSVDEQGQAGRDAAAEHGWRVTAEYGESVSASRYTKRRRPEWDRLVADVRAGRLDVVVLWEPSRGDRKLTNWSEFLDTCRATGTNVYVTSHDKVYNLENSHDWRSLAEEGISSVTESDRTSLRVKRAYAAAYSDGRPMGRIPYGYARRYDPVTRRADQQPHPDTAAIVREIIGRIAANEPVSRIVTDLAERGVPSPTGRKRWARSSVIALVNETYTGKRRVGGQLLDGDWPELVEPEVLAAAQRVIADPARKAQADGRGGIRPGSAKWLCSYIATCAECGGPLSVSTKRKGGPEYRCAARGHCSAPVAFLDFLVSAAIVRWCSNPEIFRVLTAVDSGESETMRAEARAERDRLAEFEAQAVSGAVSAESFSRVARGIETHIAELEARATELSAPPALRDLLRGAAESALLADREEILRNMWETMSVSARRNTVRTLCEPTLAPAGSHPESFARVAMNFRRG